MKVTWDKIEQGDFFFIDLEDYGSMLYQRIKDKEGYNTVLLNTGELCCIYAADPKKLYQKVTVTFNIHND